MISFAQNFEDVMLARIFAPRMTGFYIDVGAMDPVDGSVTKHFYDLGWCGVNVEPDGRFHEKLLSERTRDVNLNVALGESDDLLPFYQFELQGVSTFNAKFRQYFTDRGSEFHTRQQAGTTLAGICERHVAGEIDFLKIDAEGWEGPIIRGADWARFRPVVLVVEGTEPYSHIPAWESWEPYLVEAGYAFAYYDGLNRFYVRNESWDALRDRFAFPPNVLDGFKLAVTDDAERERDRLSAENRKLESLLEAANREREAAIDSLMREHEAAILALKRERQTAVERLEQKGEAAIESLKREQAAAIESVSSLHRASISDLEAAKSCLGTTKAKLERTLLELSELTARAAKERREHEMTAATLRKSDAQAKSLAERLDSAAAEIARMTRAELESRIGTGRIAQERALANQLAERLLHELRSEREHRERAERECESLRNRLDETWAAKEKERMHWIHSAERMR